MLTLAKDDPAADAAPPRRKRPAGLIMIIIYKAVWGFFEALSGILVLFSYKIISAKLAEDPQDLFLNWMLDNFSYKNSLQVGYLFIILGAIKLILAAGLFFNARLTRYIAIAFFSGVAVFGLYHLAVRFSTFEFVVLLIDVVILFYFWLILPRHLQDRGPGGPG